MHSKHIQKGKVLIPTDILDSSASKCEIPGVAQTDNRFLSLSFLGGCDPRDEVKNSCAAPTDILPLPNF